MADDNISGALKYKVNWILDEFGNIATMPSFSSMITAARSRNMRYYMFVQSLNQIENKYEDYKNIIANCSKIFLHSNESDTLNQISDLLGIKIINGCKYPLASPSELQLLSKEKGEALVLKNRCKPYMTRLTDIDSFPMFSFEFEDIPVKSRKTILDVEVADIFENICNNKRSFYFHGSDISINKYYD